MEQGDKFFAMMLMSEVGWLYDTSINGLRAGERRDSLQAKLPIFRLYGPECEAACDFLEKLFVEDEDTDTGGVAIVIRL